MMKTQKLILKKNSPIKEGKRKGIDEIIRQNYISIKQWYHIVYSVKKLQRA